MAQITLINIWKYLNNGISVISVISGSDTLLSETGRIFLDPVKTLIQIGRIFLDPGKKLRETGKIFIDSGKVLRDTGKIFSETVKNLLDPGLFLIDPG